MTTTEQTRRAFFLILDRGGTVRAAATSVGVSADIGYRWCRQAGVSTPRGPSRQYTSEEKAEFFRLLAERGDVSSVARELGFTRVTCYQWAHKAGIFTSQLATARRQRYLQMRADGVSRVAAAAQAGVHLRAAMDWDKGIRQVVNGRVYPDGRVATYGPTAGGSLPRVTSGRAAYIHGDRVDLTALEHTLDRRFLTLAEREQIHDLKGQGASLRAIARTLGRAASTVSRELARNTSPQLGYLPYDAHRRAAARRPRPKMLKLLAPGPLRDYVLDGLAQRWSPEQVSHRLRHEFRTETAMRACPETIYQAIYTSRPEALVRQQPTLRLRRRRTTRKPHRSVTRRSPRFVAPMTPLADRPRHVELRQQPGHWEGDLIVGAGGLSAIGTLVERTSRYLLLVHLNGDRSAANVRAALVTAMRDLPRDLRRSLTWDQGSEMAEHHAFTLATGMPVYFCDPASPWQRGTNENTNGLLREYFPKGTSLSGHTPEQLLGVATQLNDRPRKTLAWATPHELITPLLQS